MWFLRIIRPTQLWVELGCGKNNRRHFVRKEKNPLIELFITNFLNTIIGNILLVLLHLHSYSKRARAGPKASLMTVAQISLALLNC